MRVIDPGAELRRTLDHSFGNDDLLLHQAPGHRLENLRGLRAGERAIVAEAHDDLVLGCTGEHVPFRKSAGYPNIGREITVGSPGFAFSNAAMSSGGDFFQTIASIVSARGLIDC